jgi:hypothetical protein
LSPTQDRWRVRVAQAQPGRRAFEALALAAILGIAAWLRLTGLDRTSLFGDEAVYSGQAAVL